MSCEPHPKKLCGAPALIFAWGSLLVLTSCQTSEEHVLELCQPVVGGEATVQGEFGGIAWLEGGCSATLVSEQLLLFAGHCGDTHSKAYFGEWLQLEFSESPDELILTGGAFEVSPIQKCVVHPSSAVGTPDDIAFCILREARPTSDVIPLAGFPISEGVAAGDELLIVGFGYDGVEGDLGTKNQAVATVASVGTGLMVGDSTRGTCKGDSGGPALVTLSGEPSFAVVGVLSGGYTKDDCGAGWYTIPIPHQDWIERESGVALPIATNGRSQNSLPCVDGSDGE